MSDWADFRIRVVFKTRRRLAVRKIVLCNSVVGGRAERGAIVALRKKSGRTAEFAKNTPPAHLSPLCRLDETVILRSLLMLMAVERCGFAFFFISFIRLFCHIFQQPSLLISRQRKLLPNNSCLETTKQALVRWLVGLTMTTTMEQKKRHSSTKPVMKSNHL